MDIIKVGDRITFRSPTRDGCRTATRVVNGFYAGDTSLPTVRYNGWAKFAVRQWEITLVNGELYTFA